MGNCKSHNVYPEETNERISNLKWRKFYHMAHIRLINKELDTLVERAIEVESEFLTDDNCEPLANLHSVPDNIESDNAGEPVALSTAHQTELPQAIPEISES